MLNHTPIVSNVEVKKSNADDEYIFPYMKVNEAEDIFMIDWTYKEYHFAIYEKSPERTSDRDMAGKIALDIIRNLGADTTNIKIDYGTSSIYTKAEMDAVETDDLWILKNLQVQYMNRNLEGEK